MLERKAIFIYIVMSTALVTSGQIVMFEIEICVIIGIIRRGSSLTVFTYLVQGCAQKKLSAGQ